VRVVLATSLPHGGPVEQALVLAGALVALGVDVDAVVATPELAERFGSAGARVALIGLRSPADAAGAARLARFARGADVVHAHDRRTGLWVRLGPRPRRGGLRVYTAHGIPFEFHPPPVGSERPGLRALVAYRGLDAALSRRSDATIVPSQALADDLATRLGYPRDQLVVVPNGIRIGPPVDPRGQLVGTLSVHERFKGLDVFARAAAVLARERPELRFALFGAGSQTGDLRELVDGLGIGDRTAFPGFRPAEEAFAQLGVYVLSSYWENAPMALLEAMAAGVPIVATGVHGVPEIVDESTARMVAPGDPEALASAVAATLDDAEGTARRTAAARRRVGERFSAEANARAILALYERLLRRRGGGA
jgi:glycosyltransferase involved in cell wall biosynthesis